MIAVTGATGNIGRPLVEILTAAGEAVTAISRNAAELPAGAVHVEADLSDPASLRPAFEGAERLLLLTPGTQFDLPAIVAAAKDAGAERVVLVSSQRVGSRPEEGLGAMEAAVTESGLEWTVLRPGGFASNAYLWAEQIRAERAVAAPFGDVGLPVVDPADIADVAAITLRERGHTGRRYTLTGPAPVSPREQTAAIAAALGEPIEFVEQTRDQALETLSRMWPAEVVEAILKVLGSPNEAERAVSPEIENLTGRPARSFADWARRNTAAFR
ncbi:NAD(P)H-binding protein [Glycomyces salinus]|uniref:NAD(P)H-binding protein n=1 Tax=Glycomyces salinus TaxID=980294 RepID=UPI0018EB343D|nr:NAD(P)H-binding protein [Glycomyces salinus]